MIPRLPSMIRATYVRLTLMTVAFCGIALIGAVGFGDDSSRWQSVVPQGPVGVCGINAWKQDFPGCEFEDGVQEGHLHVVPMNDERYWRITCKAGEIGPERGGVGWRWPFPQPVPKTEARREAELRYTIQFEDGFEYVKGGKLPGLCGGPKTITGGDQCTGYDGWSVRIMWRRDGRGQAYAYHPRMKGKYGDEYDFPSDFRFPIDLPIRLRLAVKMNHPNAADGSLRISVQMPEEPERIVVEELEMQWTKSQSIGVDSLLFNVFHGGNDRSWAPTQDVAIRIGAMAYR